MKMMDKRNLLILLATENLNSICDGLNSRFCLEFRLQISTVCARFIDVFIQENI